ncbi:transposase zinc-binding domain-containing protein [Myxococcus xanthus]|uniref:transposase zinc-binding domain-containing protein n=1 Tax=Myxococcus xanthus TaxID=34 RepID=UPI0034516792
MPWRGGAGEGQVEERGWAYRRRQPEATVLYEAVRENLATLLAEASDVGRGLPRYVERDFSRYLECGVLVHGFARVRCESCKDELLVAFSCKGRGVCPSCNAKRAQVTAVHLVEGGLLSDVLTLFLRAVFALQRRRARRQGVRGGQAGTGTAMPLRGARCAGAGAAVTSGGRPHRLSDDGKLDEIAEAPMENFGGFVLLVRRNDAAVKAVLNSGREAVREGAVAPSLGRERGFGKVLRAQYLSSMKFFPASEASSS